MDKKIDPHTYIPDIIYGPVQSRRHGKSLGINVGLPNQKICTWSCLYCQCGFGERREFNISDHLYSSNEIVSALEKNLSEHQDINVVTLAGNSEPGAHPEIKKIIHGILELRIKFNQKWKLIILSNGSELYKPDVKEAFSLANEAWIKLDVSKEDLFQKLNRPLAKIGSLENHLNAVASLKPIRIQTLLWNNFKRPELANFNQTNLQGLYEIFKKILPTSIQIITISRDPALEELTPIDYQSELFQGFYSKTLQLGIDVNYY